MRPRRAGFWYRFGVCVAKPPLWLLTRRRWSGAEHVPRQGTGVIVAANHLSHLDPFVLTHFLLDGGPRRLPRFLAKSGLFSVFFVGTVLRGAEQIPVKRYTEDASLALAAAVRALQAGRCVLIYPEGTTTKRADYWPGPTKTGVARLALLSGAPVVPVAHWGVQRIFGIDRKLHLRPTPVAVAAGPPVDLSRYAGLPLTSEVLHAATADVMDAIVALLSDLRGEAVPADLGRSA